MTEQQIGLIITGLFMVAVAAVTGWWAHRNKKTPEPTPIEKLWSRLDAQDVKIDGLNTEVGTLSRAVTAYRGGFLAFVSWSERVTDGWPTGPIPIIAFTREEDQAIKKGLDLASLDSVHPQ